MGELKVHLAEYEAMHVQHAMIDPEDREINDWNSIIKGVGNIGGG